MSAISSSPSDPVLDPADRLVLACLECPSHERREALEGACARHPELAQELRRRLRLLEESGLLDPGAAAPGFPERIGDFRLLQPLGGGGMGVVYVAWQESMGREVALKLVRPEQVLFSGARERFRREAAAVSCLRHPGIVPVHAFGEEDGIPFLAMERVEGATLAELLCALPRGQIERLRGQDLLAALARVAGEPSEAARELLQGAWSEACARIALRLAEALQHAHERGVVHRDVKPSNVMLALDGRVMLFDFGLARAAGATRVTGEGAQPGSVPYMAPEQLRGESADERSDVYALGVTLYEMLASSLPFWDQTSELLRRKILEARPVPLRQRNRALPRDLEMICMSAMDPSPGRRYARAADLAADLRRFLQHRPVRARPAGLLLRIARACQRHPVVAVTASALTVLVAGGPVAINLAIARERDAAVLRAYTASVVAADYALARHDARAARARLAACPEALRGFEWRHLSLEADRSRLHLPAMRGWLESCRLLAGDDRLVFGGGDGVLRLLRQSDGRVLWERPLASGGLTIAVAGDLVAAAGRGREVYLVAAQSGEVSGRLVGPEGARFVTLRFAAGGRLLAAGARDGRIVVFDVPRRSRSRVVAAHGHLRDVDAAGRRALVDDLSDMVLLIDLVAGGAPRTVGPGWLAAFAPDGDTAALAARDGRLRIVSLPHGRLLREWQGHRGAVNAVRFGPRGKLYTCGNDSTVRIWNPVTGRAEEILDGHLSAALSVDAAANGTVVSVSPYSGMRLWDPSFDAHCTRLRAHDCGIAALVWLAGGRMLATASEDGTIALFDARTAERRAVLDVGTRIACAAADPAHDRLAALATSGPRALWLFDTGQRRLLARLPVAGHGDGALVFSPDGALLAASSSDGSIVLFDVVSGAPVAVLAGHRARVRALAFSPDGRELWSGDAHGRILVHEVEDRHVRLRTAVEGAVHALACSPDAASVYCAAEPAIVRLRCKDGSVEATYAGHLLWSHDLALTRDGARIASASHDGTVRVWHAETGDDLLVLEGNGEYAYAVEFSPDGRRLASAGENGFVTIWESERRVR